MYSILKFQITAGNFRVDDVQRRINRTYAMGNIDDTQLDELLALMYEKANPDAERPDVMEMLQAINARLADLAQRVALLESSGSTDGSGEIGSDYPAWESWDGLSDQYQFGAIVTHNGKLWISAYKGQNVWEPGVVDDRFWAPYTPSE